MVEPRLSPAHQTFAIDFGSRDAPHTPSNITIQKQHSTSAHSQLSALTQQLDAGLSPHKDALISDRPGRTTPGSQHPNQNAAATLPSVHVRHPSVVDTANTKSDHDQPHIYNARAWAVTPSIVIPSKSLRTTLSTKSMNSSYSKSPASAISSPALAAMSDITPLPSPIFPEDSVSAWRKDRARRHGSAGSLRSLVEDSQVQDFSPSKPASRSPSLTKKRNAYSGISTTTLDTTSPKTPATGQDKCHVRVHSLGERKAEPMHSARPRNSTLSSVTSSNTSPVQTSTEAPLHREDYLAEKRGFLQHTPEESTHTSIQTSTLPTPPPSSRSVNDSDNDDLAREPNLEKNSSAAVFAVHDIFSNNNVVYEQVRPLGLGSFSKVVLATKQRLPHDFQLDEHAEPRLDAKQLVAIKIVDHGSTVGPDEERMELSLKREVELMRSVKHPSLIDLHQYSVTKGQALLVLGYCPGGDLFELASENSSKITPQFVQRLFAELVGALQHLHQKNIVHRDIKLENVLVNMRADDIFKIQDPITYPKSFVTITDLGLSRLVDPEQPLLTTRCGSEAYAAPEIILGQPYDGRETDAWALGVVLFTLIELRLPFDQLPSRPGYRVRSRGRMTHRIARNDWAWWKFGDDDGEWDEQRGAGWEGARDVIDGLLRKVNKGRLTLDQVAELPWVKEGINVPGGIRRGYEAAH